MAKLTAPNWWGRRIETNEFEIFKLLEALPAKAGTPCLLKKFNYR
jgi:hypothetical protein